MRPLTRTTGSCNPECCLAAIKTSWRCDLVVPKPRKLSHFIRAHGRAAHIHEGARGSNGPVVAALAWPQNGQAGDCISEATEGKFPTKEAGIVQRILKNPQNFYINVHNSVHPAGAIRGQLAETPHVH